ncbi:Fur-regulated basic protein FbpA [Bacillus sp. PK3_68]|uniref:Fur-regulated basic protein FbpA n=1 Tax=Bacillus sp. PK3_68 TaxID=2027408 RepID=UPI000E751C60|nr:Fur-regulated basic protein FbpA [Bacillus sp. PK3_68]
MGDILNKVIINRKEQLIQQMLKWESYKSTDERQLYELTLSELEHEYQKMYKDHSNIR